MFTNFFIVGIIMTTNLSYCSFDNYEKSFDEQTDSTNFNAYMPIQQSYSASSVTNTESNTDLLTSIAKRIWLPRKNITVFETVCVSNYTFFLYDSIKFIENNYFFECFYVCNLILKMGLSSKFININICNHPKFKNSFNVSLLKYLHDTELLLNRDFKLETVHLIDTCYEFITDFNSRSEHLGLIDDDQLRTYSKLYLDRLGIKYDSEKEKNAYVLKITDLLYLNTFQIFNILFPEIKLVYGLIERENFLKNDLKKFHLFITYTAFKIKINETILKKELEKCVITGKQSFTDSKLLLSFIYNVRLDFTLMSFSLSFKPYKLNFLVALTYLSFLRLNYPSLMVENDLSEFIILEMYDLENVSSFVSECYNIELIKEKPFVVLEIFLLRYESKENTRKGSLSKDNPVFNSDFVNSDASNQPDVKSVLELATFRPFSDLKKYFGI